ncbi:Protein NDH-DEPENDENT CYCLIC ELECTRON FLOW 5 [Linum perenne]
MSKDKASRKTVGLHTIYGSASGAELFWAVGLWMNLQIKRYFPKQTKKKTADSLIFNLSLPKLQSSISMAASSLLTLNLTNPTSRTLIPTYLSSYHPNNRRSSFLLRSVYSPNQKNLHIPPLNVDYLEQEFGGHGVKFQTLEETCCVGKMKMSNGSSAKFLLPQGLITSYKPKMWHGGTMEVIQTSVAAAAAGGGDGGAVIQGGVSLAMRIGDGWSPIGWGVADVRGDSSDCIEVELVCTNAVEHMLDTRYTITMTTTTLISELKLTNLNPSSPIQITGSILTHLTVSTPEATTACGLEGSNFVSSPMLRSSFAIVPPKIAEEPDFFNNFWSDGRNRNEEEEGMEGEEGRRNSVVVGREGFDELYIYSPGSSHDSYDKFSYIAIAQSALLKPVILPPGEVWIGRQHLHNPNL